jgi:mono/diheme cytochrome c family protein
MLRSAAVSMAVGLSALAWADGAGSEAPRGSSGAGRLVALRACAACHEIAPRDAWYSNYARSFAEIANDPALGRPELDAFLAKTHKMFWPGLALSDRERADVIAYIASQATAPHR